jgi:hypothetical protein
MNQQEVLAGIPEAVIFGLVILAAIWLFMWAVENWM